MKNVLKHSIFFLLFAWMAFAPMLSFAQDSVQEPKKEKFDAKSFIFGHTGDSYCFHITEIKGEPVCVWLPVIVKCKDGGGWHCFSSKHVCELKEGETFNHKGANFYIPPISAEKYPGKLVEVKADGSLSRPFDISFTKNAFGIFVTCIFLVAFFLPAARKYKKDPMAKPTKYQGLVEWLTYMVLDGIVRPNIREAKVKKFAPYLLTVFFFIFFANLFGLIPFFPFGANVTGNLSITVVLALMTYFFVTHLHHHQALRPDGSSIRQHLGWSHRHHGAHGLDLHHWRHVWRWHGRRDERRLYLHDHLHDGLGAAGGLHPGLRIHYAVVDFHRHGTRRT